MKPVEVDNSAEYKKARKKLAVAVAAVFAAVLLILIIGGFNSAGTVNVLWIRAGVSASGVTYTSEIQENIHTLRTDGITTFSFSLYNPSGHNMNITSISSVSSGFTILSSNLPLNISPHSSAPVNIEVRLPGVTYAGDLNLIFT